MQADKDGDQVQHNPEHHGNHLHVEEGKDEQCPTPEAKYQSIANIYGVITIGQAMIFCHTRTPGHQRRR